VGLDIIYYNSFTEAEIKCNGNVEDYIEEHYDDLYELGFRSLYRNSFGTADDVPDHVVISGESQHFRAGSYSGYNWWRNKLAEVIHGVSAEKIWKNLELYNNAPFFELLHFSDCEGVIGPAVSAKLAKDFRDHKDLIHSEKNSNIHEYDEYFTSTYDNFMEAFETAAEGGFVKFC
jgi:hypothetical protein